MLLNSLVRLARSEEMLAGSGVPVSSVLNSSLLDLNG